MLHLFGTGDMKFLCQLSPQKQKAPLRALSAFKILGQAVRLFHAF